MYTYIHRYIYSNKMPGGFGCLGAGETGETFWALKPALAGLGRTRGQLERTWGRLGRSWGELGRSWGQFERTWSKLERSWAQLGLSWASFGQCWGARRLCWPPPGLALRSARTNCKMNRNVMKNCPDVLARSTCTPCPHNFHLRWISQGAR